VDFPGGTSVVAQPVSGAQAASLPAGLRLAVVLDRSYSMRGSAGQVEQAFAALRRAVGSGPDPDLYLTASAYRGEGPSWVAMASFNPAQVVYLGGQDAAELLAQYQALSAGKAYDLVLVLTDGSGYELGPGNLKIEVPGAPVWLVHLGGFPLGYDDPTQQAIQASGGGIAATVEEALARYAAGRDAPGQADRVDGYTWQTLPTAEAAGQGAGLPAGGGDGFAALAARRVILAEMARNRGNLAQLPALDALHKLAVEQGIVTPYSSMLVLVDAAQQRLLDEQAGQDDRFQREVEKVGITAAASPLAVTGVPEPEEWLLMILAALAVVYVAWRKAIHKAGRLA
jgi:putative PEP-CTERM system integral membrane protein